jgi:predicted permease
MIYQLLKVVAPTFAIVAVGWVWARLGQKYDTELVTSLVMKISGPCLVFSTLSVLDISPYLLGEIGIATLMAAFLFGLSGSIALRIAGLPLRGYLPPVIFPNIGNMGLPVCLFAYGKTGLAFAIIVFAIFVVGQFTIGQWLYSGHISTGNLIKDPFIYSLLLALVFLVTRVTPPEMVIKTTGLLGDFTIPLMLLTLGVTLARLQVLNIKRSLYVSILRLGLGFGTGVLISSILGLSGAVRGVLILQCAMPAAVFNYLLAERYHRNPDETAEILVTSTLLAIVALPLILEFLQL